MHQDKNEGRRNFLKTASIGGLAALSIPAIVTSAFAAEKVKKVRLNNNDVILFQGDSITDARRKRDDMTVNSASALGSGYAFMAASDLLCNQAGKNLQIYNKGISGNKVYQLAERWDTDALELNPNVLSLLIGVNDFWHSLVRDYKGTIKTYRDDYRALLDRTKQQLPDVRLIIGEPFAVPGIKSVDDTWFPAFNEYRQAAREIAANYGAGFIPYQSVFDKAQKTAPGVYWTYDGVHPTIAGNRLMAQAWLEAVKG
ncbi:SGNH/GDSL hydrolase family protein [Pontibacter beigongshangensis]|uniref:SGNH/GDSL hydrolase family protein n=1 Tax=Pontibacter beigongshangensis TaxID=2574733 RepID=UPI001650981F|nr:SGNH/GDSL hydrolase family protein [Pontibacter beigongshangensis]